MIAGVADIHALLWFIFSDLHLSQKAKHFIDETYKAGNQIAVSSISLVEMVYLIEKGRIQVESLSRVAYRLREPNSLFTEVKVELDIARFMSKVSVLEVPDMPDRIIAATALAFNVPVISRDGKIRLSSISTIW